MTSFIEEYSRIIGLLSLGFRDYSHPKLYQPVFFLIMQSTNRSSFHPPVVGYPALGYTIETEGKEKIPVQNVSWVEEFAIPGTEFGM